jgi:hypothetical protein
MTNRPNQSGWSFDTAFDAPSSVSEVGTPPISPPVVVPKPHSRSRGRTRPRRGQRLSWISLSLAIAGALAIGVGLYNALVSVAMTNNAYAHVSAWMTFVIVTVGVLVLNLAGSFLALVWARPRVVAALALMLTLLLPAVGAFAGVKLGVDILAELLHERAVGIGQVAIKGLVSLLLAQGYDLPPVVLFLIELLGY